MPKSGGANDPPASAIPEFVKACGKYFPLTTFINIYLPRLSIGAFLHNYSTVELVVSVVQWIFALIIRLTAQLYILLIFSAVILGRGSKNKL